MAGLVELEVEYQRLLAERNALGDRYEAGEKNLLPQIKELNQRLRTLITQIEALQAVNSSGQLAREDQKANASGASAVDPNQGDLIVENGRIKRPPDTTSGSNALKFNPDNNLSFGTDAELRPYIQTQSTAPGSSQTSPGVSYRVPGYPSVNEDAFIGGNFTGGIGGPSAGGQAGAGAAGDDQGTASNAVTTELNAIDYTNKILPKENVLDQYANYTYQASLYLMDKNSYETMVNTKQKNLNGAQLLVQSGGGDSVGRNQYFTNDYYIDSIDLKSFIVGRAVKLAHNVSNLKMTIIEPNGISFINNLDSAVQQFVGGANEKKRNFTAQIYLLVIRFYGYDDQGNLVRGGTNKPDQTSDPNAFVEKWYPLILTGVKFKVANKAVEYQIDAVAVPYNINCGSARGSIPFNIELSGATLKDILAGPAVYGAGQAAVSNGGNSSATQQAQTNFANTLGGAAVGARLNVRRNIRALQSNQATQASVRAVDNAIAAIAAAPSKADAANTPRKTVRSGLMAALNEYQRDLVKQGVYTYPDEYEVEFALDSMASAKVTNAGLNIGATSMSQPGTAADQKLGSKQSMDPNSRIEGAAAGMQIVQFIDNLVRNSTYIRDQQIVITTENPAGTKATNVNIKNTSWYKIGFEAQAKLDQFDKQRNDYAYKIKFIIAPYKLAQLNSPYFKPPTINGVHKEYKYWFSGENSAILDYEENFNYLYYSVLSGANLGGIEQNANSILKFQYQTASGQSTQGAEAKTLEPAANAADQLYNPSDLGECTMTIVGDPAWLQQGESFVGLKKGDPYYFSAFLKDGTINFDSQQILFAVGYNRPEDYNLSTGIVDVNSTLPSPAAQKSQESVSSMTTNDSGLTTKENRVYITKEVQSKFAKGKFTQVLKGSLVIYSPPQKLDTDTARKAASVGAKVQAQTNIPRERSGVTNPTPTSALARGTQQILQPATQLDNPTLSQLQASPVYIQARKGGATPAAALEAARASFAAGTNNAGNFALPGIRAGTQYIVKDQ